MAARLRGIHGLKTPGAIHAASAISAGSAGLVTNDRDLRLLSDELGIWTFQQAPGTAT